jgi:hypothetical protein
LIGIKFSSSATIGVALITVVGGEVEMSSAKFLHSGDSKGPYFNVSEGGVVVLNGSQITSDPQIGFI